MMQTMEPDAFSAVIASPVKQSRNGPATTKARLFRRYASCKDSHPLASVVVKTGWLCKRLALCVESRQSARRLGPTTRDASGETADVEADR